MGLSLRFAARSDVGLIRSNNQDSGYAGPQLLVVADGMGGAAAGDVASSVAVAHLAPLDGQEYPSSELLDKLRIAVGDSHEDLVQYSTASPVNAGLGTTVVALLRSGATAAMVHIGDSRAYVVRDGQLHQVTHDHTYVQHLIDTGQINEEEAQSHPQRSVILRVLGDSATTIELDESIREIHDGDRWLLCSDGLSSYVSAETIAAVVGENPDPGRCADELVSLALRAGGQDNITVIVADVVEDATDPGGLPPTEPQVVGAAAADRSAPTRGGDSAAARAAALMSAHEEEDLDEDEDEEDSDDDEGERDIDAPRRRRPLFSVILTLLVLALLAGGVALGWRWTQNQYYVAGDRDGAVAIYRGIPQTLGPISLSSIAEVSDVQLADLAPFVQDRVEAGITAGSLAQARTTIDGLREETEPEPTQTATPTDDASAPDPGPTQGED